MIRFEHTATPSEADATIIEVTALIPDHMPVVWDAARDAVTAGIVRVARRWNAVDIYGVSRDEARAFMMQAMERGDASIVFPMALIGSDGYTMSGGFRVAVHRRADDTYAANVSTHT